MHDEALRSSQLRDVSEPGDISSRLTRLCRITRRNASEAARLDPCQAIDNRSFRIRYLDVLVPQLLAARLHIAQHALSMRKATGAIKLTDRLTSHLGLKKEPTQIYAEDAFQHFLNLERERSIRSGRRSLLVRIGLKSRDGSSKTLRRVADGLFAGLEESIRETDFMGWYREPRVVGAVLTELAGERSTDVLATVVARIQRACEDRMPMDASSRLDISVTAITDAEDQS